VLSALAGIALQFGFSGVAHRNQAQAALNAPGADLTAAALASPGAAAPGGNFVTQVYKTVSPSVVHITNRIEQQQMDFFRGPVTSVAEAVGSGVIVDPAGYILTNSHVIENAGRQTLTVVLSDQTTYPATLAGNDPSTDLALLKIEAGKPLPVATLGDSNNVDIGEWVVAIGNPRGFDWTVTAGVISAKNRSGPAWERNGVSGPTITGLLQTDAAINPGNSGGPLLNARGEVIGINERIFSSSGGSEGIGLAIPSNTARSVVDEIKKYGHVQRSWLGLNVRLEVDPQSANYFNFPVKHGLLIGNIIADSPAARAGIVQGRSDRSGYAFDIVGSVDGKAVNSAQDLVTLVRNRKPGQSVKLHLYRVRNGKTSEADVNITLSAVPAQADTSGYI
jgi:serine protease Do